MVVRKRKTQHTDSKNDPYLDPIVNVYPLRPIPTPRYASFWRAYKKQVDQDEEDSRR
jgi:hypothetical protein